MKERKKEREMGEKRQFKEVKKKSIISANIVWVIFGWLPFETVLIKAICAALILPKVMQCRWVTLRPC